MRPLLSKTETWLLAACAGLLALAVLGPALAQAADHHAFADRRVLWGIPFAMDVLSNLPFALAGLAGAWTLQRLPAGALGGAQRTMAALFFTGLLLTAAGSAWYHWRPDDAGLAIDRCGMAVAFAGLLGLAAAGRISERAGDWLGGGVLLAAPAAVGVWMYTGNVLPWAVVQFGGVALLLAFALMRPRADALPIRWGLVLLAYAAAKLLELNDHAVYELTDHRVAGHALKHAVAALAAWPVLAAVGALRKPRQNPAGAEGRSNTSTGRRQAGHA